MTDPTLLIGTTIAAIVLLLILVLWVKLHPFLSLLITAMFLGVATGMPLASVTEAVKTGLGGTLGFVATVVGIGTIFGQILESSGGTESLAQSLIKKFGPDKANLSLMLTGFLVAIPVFFEVGFIVLVPLVFSLARDTKKSTLYYAIPLLAGLAVTHTFVPPTPGPVATAEMLGADLGWVILMGIIVGLPVAIIAGPLFGTFISKRVYIAPPPLAEMHQVSEDTAVTENPGRKELPSLGMVVSIIGIPLVLIVISSFAEFLVKQGYIADGYWIEICRFVGHPFTALIIATLLAGWLLCTRRGFTRTEVLNISTKALAPAGMIILIIGAGGALKQMLIDSGVGDMLAKVISQTNMPPIVLAFMIAAVIRLILGSATVSMITAAGIIAPILDVYTISEIHRALIVLSIASGATIFSHVNDSGFWLIGKYLRMTEVQTLKSWSVMETLIAVFGFVLSLILSFFV